MVAGPASFEFEEVITKRFWWFSLALFLWSPRVPLLPPASPDGAEGGPDTCRSGEKDGKGGSDPGAMGRAVLGQDWWLLALTNPPEPTDSSDDFLWSRMGSTQLMLGASKETL